MKTSDRKHYIDNLRWSCILLLIPFHAAMAWNSLGEGNYIYFAANKFLSSFIMIISPWYMPLLFVLAGISTRYALIKRNYAQFATERIKKLFIPLVTGIITVVALMAYLADCFNKGYTGSYLNHYLYFFTHLTDFSGYDGCWTPGHLWFLLYLFIISLICLVIIAVQRKLAPNFSINRLPIGIVMMLCILTSISEKVLNIGGKSIAKFLILFLAGYYIFAEEEILKKLSKYIYLLGTIFILTDIATTYLFIWIEKSDMLCFIACRLAEWFGILTLLGWSRIHFNQSNIITNYFTKRSFLIYIFHFGWLVLLQFYLNSLTSNIVILYSVSIFGSFILTLVTAEIIINIPGLRVLFGIKK